MNENQRPNDDARKREAERILEGVERDTETIGRSSMSRVGERTRDHFLGKDADPEDFAELWGRRIGRALSLAAVIALFFYLLFTYVL